MTWTKYMLMLAIGLLMAGCIEYPYDPCMKYYDLSDAERKPEHFEPYLKRNPRDCSHRVAAIIWYNRRERDLERLKHHTLQMIQRHPWNMHVWADNSSVCLSHTDYGKEIIALLEARVPQHPPDYSGYLSLGILCKAVSIPVHDGTEESMRETREDHDLSPEAPLVMEVDEVYARKAATHFSSALAEASISPMMQAPILISLLEVYIALEDYDAARSAAEKATALLSAPENHNLIKIYQERLQEQLDRLHEHTAEPH